jgi:hypothetical protein
MSAGCATPKSEVIVFFLPPEDPYPVLIRPNAIPE